jgi:hypothetical protein
MKPLQSKLLIPVAALMIAACANQMQPAKQALDGATSAVNAAATDAAAYMPEHYKTLQSRLADLNVSFDQRQYSAVLANAPGLTADAQSVAVEAAGKKADMMKGLSAQWTHMSTSVPNDLQKVEARMKTVARERRPAKGVDVSTAKTDLSDANNLWSKALSLHSEGKDDEAVDTGKKVEDKITAAADALKFKLAHDTKVASG